MSTSPPVPSLRSRRRSPTRRAPDLRCRCRSFPRRAAGSDLPDPARLEGHALPTRILAWVDDPSHPLATAQGLHALLPESRLTVAQTPTDLVSWPQILAEEVARHGVWPAGSSPA